MNEGPGRGTARGWRARGWGGDEGRERATEGERGEQLQARRGSPGAGIQRGRVSMSEAQGAPLLTLVPAGAPRGARAARRGVGGRGGRGEWGG